MKKKSHTQHQQYNDKVAYIKHKTFINWMNKTRVVTNKYKVLDFPLTSNECLVWLIIITTIKQYNDKFT